MSTQEKVGLGVLVVLLATLAVLLVVTFRSPGGGGQAGSTSDNAIVRHTVQKHSQ